MGQELMNWTMPAGSQFEEFGPRARDRRQIVAAREARAEHAVADLPGRFGSLTVAAIFGAFEPAGRGRAATIDCCAAA